MEYRSKCGTSSSINICWAPLAAQAVADKAGPVVLPPTHIGVREAAPQEKAQK